LRERLLRKALVGMRVVDDEGLTSSDRVRTERYRARDSLNVDAVATDDSQLHLDRPLIRNR
jgi:hypothetical protein